MKIAIDLTSFDQKYGGGVGTYSKSLLIALCETMNVNSILILCTFENYDWILEHVPPTVDIKPISPKNFYLSKLFYALAYHIIPHPLLLKFGQRLRWMDCIKVLRKYKIDLVYTPTTYLNFTDKKLKSIVSLHDCQEMRYPKFFSQRQLKYRRVNAINTIKNSYSIQVSSKFVKEEIKNFFPKLSNSKNFTVINEGVDTRYFHSPIKQRDYKLPILLMPASFHLHKNHRLVYESLSKLTVKTPFEIWFTGVENEVSRKLVESYTYEPNIIIKYLGFLSKSELLECYQLATVVLSTSLYESSSLTLLEGISTGCIPLASNIPAHAEMSKLLIVKLFESNNPSSLAEFIDDILILHNSRDLSVIVKSNDIYIKDFDWRRIASNYWDNFLKSEKQERTN